MIQRYWWGSFLNCPECKTECTLQLAFFASDGQLQFKYWCPKCKAIYNWDVYATQLAHQALMNDIRKFSETSTFQPVQPPLRLKGPLVTDQDKKDAKEFGIDWDKE